MERLLPLLVVVAVTVAVSWWYRRSNGAVRSPAATFTAQERRALGVPAGRQSLLLFTSPGCASCAAARQVLDALSQHHDAVVVTADVTDHHAVAAAQHSYRAPTTIVLDQRGHALARVSGVPRQDELAGVLASAAVAVR